MTKLGINIKLVDTPNQIERKILKAMQRPLDAAIKRAAPKIDARLKILIKDALNTSPEYISLTDGQLEGELGLIDARNRLNVITDTWINSLVVTTQDVRLVRGGQGLSGGLSIRGIRSSMSDVINLPEAIFISENGEKVPWLSWLLLYGDSVILTDYHVDFNLNKIEFQYSRTGLAIMKKGGTYRIPPQYSGVEGNNFVTRALASINDQINQLIIQEILSKL